MPATKNKAKLTNTTDSGSVPEEIAAREVLTLAEAAAYLRLAEKDLVRLVCEQGLPGRRLGHEWRFLAGVTWTPEEAEECGGAHTEPAYPALLRDAFHGDLATGLLDLAGSRLAFPCDGGCLTIARER